MKFFTPAALVTLAVASNLPTVREDDYVDPLFAMIAKCVEYITYTDDPYWDANCMEYCWHMAHNPDSCGLTSAPADYNALIDCVLKRHSSTCSSNRPSNLPASGNGSAQSTKESVPQGTTTASSEVREAWGEYCAKYIYNAENEDWDVYCKQLCEHYTKNGWMHCWSAQDEHQFALCVTSRHAECSYWNTIDPSPVDECKHKIYETHGMGCIDFCDQCSGSSTEVYECAVAKAADGCKSTLYSPPVIPSPSVAAKN